MNVVTKFLDDGVVSPVVVICCDIYCFPNEVVGCEVSFPLFLEFFWKIASFLGHPFGSLGIDDALHFSKTKVQMSSEVQAICHCSTVK